MLELDRVYPGGLFETLGRYSDFLERRDEVLRNEAAYQETLANRVRREMEWLRRGRQGAHDQGSKARIQEAERLIDELAEERDRAVTRRRTSTSPRRAGRRTAPRRAGLEQATGRMRRS